MGYFVHMDCGNMDYNNDMFNKMHGLGDTSSSSTTDGGASDAAPSGGDVGVGMGESLEMNKDAIKLSSSLSVNVIKLSASLKFSDNNKS